MASSPFRRNRARPCSVSRGCVSGSPPAPRLAHEKRAGGFAFSARVCAERSETSETGRPSESVPTATRVTSGRTRLGIDHPERAELRA
jgi:hypothetical protein